MSVNKRYLVASAIPMGIIAVLYTMVMVEGQAPVALIAVTLFALMAVLAGLCWVGSLLSKGIIHMGEKIERRSLQLAFYLLLIPAILILLLFTNSYFDALETAERAANPYSYVEMGTSLSIGLKYVSLFLSAAFLLVVPYFQTIAVLLMGKFFPENQEQ